jgi:inner membrane protein
MEPVTHLLTGACLARAGFNRKAAYATLAMTLAAEMPDLDKLWSFGGPIVGFEHHRGISHTFVGLPFEAFALVGAIWLLHRTRVSRAQRLAPAPSSTIHTTDQPIVRPLTAAPVRWLLLYSFVLIALLSHILLDWTNNYGVRPFFPFNPRWYAGSFVFIFEPIMFLLLLIGILAPALFGLVAGEVGAGKPTFRGRGWAIFALTAVVALWGWRLIEHDAAIQLASTAAYGPADAPAAEILRITASPYPINPFRWHTVVETPAFYQMATADTLHDTLSTDPAQDLFYKPPPTPAIQTAKQSRLGRVYLDWSSWPLITEAGPAAPIDAPPGTPDWNAISFCDLRFLYDTPLIHGRENPPLSALVYLDASGHVARMELGGHAQK